MTLNPDCVRDVLLAMEQCEFGEHHTIASLHEDLSQYSEEELCYTCLKLALYHFSARSAATDTGHQIYQ